MALKVIMKELDPHLCVRCQRGLVAFTELGRRVTHCNAMGEYGRNIGSTTIVKCTNFRTDVDPEAWLPHSLESKAWLLEHSKGQVIGFKAPKKEGEKE